MDAANATAAMSDEAPYRVLIFPGIVIDGDCSGIIGQTSLNHVAIGPVTAFCGNNFYSIGTMESLLHEGNKMCGFVDWKQIHSHPHGRHIRPVPILSEHQDELEKIAAIADKAGIPRTNIQWCLVELAGSLTPTAVLPLRYNIAPLIAADFRRIRGLINSTKQKTI